MSTTSEQIRLLREAIDEDVLGDDSFEHYGTPQNYPGDPHGSGRYREGSGERPNQHGFGLVARAADLRNQGYKDSEIAKMLGYSSTTKYRQELSAAGRSQREKKMTLVKELHSQGMSPREISEKTGYSVSSVRDCLKGRTGKTVSRVTHAADTLRDAVDKKGYVDVGKYVENEMGCTEDTKRKAIHALEQEGYKYLTIRVSQPGDPHKRTTVAVLAKPSDLTDNEEAHKLYEDTSLIKSFSDTKRTVSDKAQVEPPASLDSKRVGINYESPKDGLVEIRPGVPDLSMGKSTYAQVRILVDNKYYVKGMAIYSDDLPDGKDVVFNTNKKKGTPMLDPDGNGVLKTTKEMVGKSDNPFGAYIPADGQTHYIGKDGKQHLSVVNKLKEEGDWDLSRKTLSSQFLSKQPQDLIERQLKLTYADRKAEFDEIKSLTNPVVKRNRLKAFAESCDAASMDMKAMAFPRQVTRVLFPVPELKNNEIYDPYHRNGEKVSLVRFPHGGTFEIPQLTVNNNNPYAKKALAGVHDGVGINHNVAQRLSGADFDGDTVLVIPTNSRVHIKSTSMDSGPFKALKGFDPSASYPPIRDGEGNIKSAVMKDSSKGKQMGMISNLITDMTLQGAPPEDLIPAVRHSMVVIDAPKHKLNYKQSEKDNNIAALKKKYQGAYNPVTGQMEGGASTLLSMRGKTVRIPERQKPGKGGYSFANQIDPRTGELLSRPPSGRTYVDKKTGKTVKATENVRLLSQVRDLRTLSSGTDPEQAYADYGNSLRRLANEARLEWLHTKPPRKDPAAAKEYADAVSSLDRKLRTAQANKPRQRRAQALVSSRLKAITTRYPELTSRENAKKLNKIRRSLYDDASIEVGSDTRGTMINITDREWEAIQHNAIAPSRVEQILSFTDDAAIQQRALPHSTTSLSPVKLEKVQAMYNSGMYTQAEIADAVGVSPSTISRALAR